MHNQSARDALLFWLNSAFRDGKDQVASLANLADGIVLLDVLRAVDPDFVDYSADHSDPARNLLAVRKGLISSFHRDSYEHLESQATKLDIHKVTDKRDQNEIAECTTLLMCLAVTGPKQEEYVAHINGLSSVNPSAFQTIGLLAGTRMKGEPDEEPEQGAAAQEEVMSDQDRVLALEASLAKTHAELDKAKKDHAETLTRLESLQLHQEELMEDAEKLQEENQWLRESETRGTADAHQIRDLKRRIEEQDAMIQSLEEKAQVLEDAYSKLFKEQAPLREKAERTQNLEDEVQELRYQNAELEKKSNAAENYKKKIMQQRDLQVEVSGLKTINQELHEKMDAQEQLLNEMPRLQEVETRFHTMLQSYETQISDLIDHKKSLEQYIRDTDRKLELLEERRSHDEKYINEMREQVESYSHTGGAGRSGAGLSLEEELEGGEGGGESSVPMSLELSRLKAENQVLRGNMASATEASQLRVELEAVENAKNRLQQKNNELFEQHTIAQEQIKALMDNMAGEGLVKAMDVCSKAGEIKLLTTAFFSSSVFATMRREREEAVRDLTRVKKLLEDLEAKVADKDRDILSARTDLAAVEKDSVSALDELKTTDQLIANSARNELSMLQQKYSDLQQEHHSQQSELVKAFLVKEKLTHELEEVKDAQEKSQDKSTNEKVEKLRSRAKHYKEVRVDGSNADFIPISKSGDAEFAAYLVDENGIAQPMSAALPRPKSTGRPITVRMNSDDELYRSFHDIAGPHLPTLPTRAAPPHAEPVRRLSPIDMLTRPLSLRSRRSSKSSRTFSMSPSEVSSTTKSIPSDIAGFFNLFQWLIVESFWVVLQQLEKAEQEKYDLQRRLKSLQDGGAAAEEKATKDQIIKNLQRENAMIATAWYDLTSRLQSNHVVLQRRHDVPKAWLNKQRQMVNAPLPTASVFVGTSTTATAVVIPSVDNQRRSPTSFESLPRTAFRLLPEILRQGGNLGTYCPYFLHAERIDFDSVMGNVCSVCGLT
ncbi:hypothetical protein MKZ38_006819 [Zalerion maritima]|uniref:Uncharacterized protein n=1 Tax=Zalerion maritima TaxID=339359 RepID=A0AAD5RWZ8_9PEZI|nr:hypothetical protein MKZ38_006819 [Zalerion maritima]